MRRITKSQIDESSYDKSNTYGIVDKEEAACYIDNQMEWIQNRTRAKTITINCWSNNTTNISNESYDKDGNIGMLKIRSNDN